MKTKLALLLALVLIGHAHAVPVKHQVTGLFMKEREQDLRDVMAELPQIKLISIDFANAEAVFDYDAAKVFPGAKSEQIVQRFDNMLRSVSRSTFGIKPLRTLPLDKLKLIEIRASGVDCKACALAAYEAIYKLEGVERATASFRESRVTALIDPAKTDQAKLENALKKRGVTLTAP